MPFGIRGTKRQLVRFSILFAISHWLEFKRGRTGSVFPRLAEPTAVILKQPTDEAHCFLELKTEIYFILANEWKTFPVKAC